MASATRFNLASSWTRHAHLVTPNGTVPIRMSSPRSTYIGLGGGGSCPAAASAASSSSDTPCDANWETLRGACGAGAGARAGDGAASPLPEATGAEIGARAAVGVPSAARDAGVGILAPALSVDTSAATSSLMAATVASNVALMATLSAANSVLSASIASLTAFKLCSSVASSSLMVSLAAFAPSNSAASSALIAAIAIIAGSTATSSLGSPIPRRLRSSENDAVPSGQPAVGSTRLTRVRTVGSTRQPPLPRRSVGRPVEIADVRTWYRGDRKLPDLIFQSVASPHPTDSKH